MTQVWEADLDDTWHVSVTRTKPYEGVLKIADLETGVVEREIVVPLMFDAMFGPDIADVEIWQELALAFVDHKGTEE